MKKFLPFMLLFLGVFAVFGILFLLVRTDALPASVRSFDWRKAISTVPTAPIEEVAV
jgi:Na+-transporting methylmalonyl-CoA/oxaloacetate decarboxylase gamma subunit